MGGGSGPTLQKRVVPFLQKVMIDENNPNARFLQMFKQSQVSVVSSGGNKYVFNSRSTYNENVKYVLNNETYTFMGVPNTHPIAILNAGKTDLITYSGDTNEGSETVTGTTADGTYDFYSGNVTVEVKGNFETVSVYCKVHGYMGGKNLLKHGQDTVDSVINNLSALFDVPVKFLSNINNPIMISRDGSTITVLLEKVKTSFSEITEITILSFKNNTYDLSSFTDFTLNDDGKETDYWFPVTGYTDYYTSAQNTQGSIGISFTMEESGRITENFTTGKDPYSFDVTKDETYSFSYYFDDTTNTPTSEWIIYEDSLPSFQTAANQISRNQSFEASAFSNEITYTNLPDYSTIDDLTVDIYVGESDQTTAFAAITDSSNGAQAGDSFGLKYNLAFGPESYEPSPQDGATYDFGSFTPVDDGLSITASYSYSGQGQDEPDGKVFTKLPNTDNGNYYAEIKYVMSGVTGGSDIETAYVAQGLTVGNTAGGLQTDGNSILFAYTFGLTRDVKDYSSEADGDSANFKVTADGSSGDLTISARDFTF